MWNKVKGWFHINKSQSCSIQLSRIADLLREEYGPDVGLRGIRDKEGKYHFHVIKDIDYFIIDGSDVLGENVDICKKIENLLKQEKKDENGQYPIRGRQLKDNIFILESAEVEMPKIDDCGNVVEDEDFYEEDSYIPDPTFTKAGKIICYLKLTLKKFMEDVLKGSEVIDFYTDFTTLDLVIKIDEIKIILKYKFYMRDDWGMQDLIEEIRKQYLFRLSIGSKDNVGRGLSCYSSIVDGDCNSIIGKVFDELPEGESGEIVVTCSSCRETRWGKIDDDNHICKSRKENLSNTAIGSKLVRIGEGKDSFVLLRSTSDFGEK